MEKGVPKYLVTVLLFVLTCSLASTSDPSPLQDFCVATKDSDEFVNEKFCNDPKRVTANDFFFSGLDKPRDTSNRQGSNVTVVNVKNLASLNTLGISVAHIDFAPHGLNPPPTHPCGTKVRVVLLDTLYIGFVTSNTNNCLFTKVLDKGDIFVFPIGLIHFEWNVGNTNALVFAALSN
ncbi:Germin-like protein subfamily 1 member 18 [Morella rubra]|uniref:Germin-like protein n=1 Tax=Morella rubra TaxID=262757 RepID=A0A6A1WP05_9ROSI|nr:Germin-like protein subfamily 1 member 18 [Morella rubra]